MERRCFEFGPFRLDPTGRFLFRGNEEIPLPPKAGEVLLLLVRNAGNVVEKEDLLTKVWPDASVEEGSLTRTVSILRKALQDGQNGQEYIATVSKRGYRFAVPVSIADEEKPSFSSSFRGMRRAGIVLLTSLAFLILASFLLWQRISGHAKPPSKRIMVAVLPVQNLTGDPERAYISDSLTEEFIGELSRFDPNHLSVIARTSSMAYQGSAKNVQQIGRELGVDFVVESSLRAEHDHIRVTAQLVRVQDQTHLWSANYDRTVQNLFSLEDELAGAVALNIGVRLQAATQKRLASGKPVNPDAYLAYLEGRYYWNKRSPQALERAIVHLQQAVQLDPTYALAYSGLADAYASQCLIADVPPQEVFSKAKTAALKAVELDRGLAEAHSSLAYIKFWYDWDWAGAESEFKQALALNPGYATAHQWYAEYLRLMGRQQEAIAENRKALELDPLSLIMNMEAGLPFYLEGKDDAAISYFNKTLEMDPNFGLAHCVLAWAYDDSSRYQEAVSEAEKALQLDDSAPVLSSLGYAYALAGRRKDAEKVLAQLTARSKTQYVSPFFLSIIYIGLHQNQRALDALDQAYSHHDWVLLWVNVGRIIRPLHSEPRFSDLLNRLHLPPPANKLAADTGDVALFATVEVNS